MDFFSNIKELQDVHKENLMLKEKLAQNKNLQSEVQYLKKDNEALRKILDKTKSIRDYNPIQATIISRSPERWIEQITIDKGTKNGIKPNMAVITSEGMIGKIQVSSDYTSVVQLLTGFDQFNRISATISAEEGKDIFGVIEQFDKESN